jgi:regulator of replication initiation timing
MNIFERILKEFGWQRIPLPKEEEKNLDNQSSANPDGTVKNSHSEKKVTENSEHQNKAEIERLKKQVLTLTQEKETLENENQHLKKTIEELQKKEKSPKEELPKEVPSKEKAIIQSAYLKAPIEDAFEKLVYDEKGAYYEVSDLHETTAKFDFVHSIPFSTIIEHDGIYRNVCEIQGSTRNVKNYELIKKGEITKQPDGKWKVTSKLKIKTK